MNLPPDLSDRRFNLNGETFTLNEVCDAINRGPGIFGAIKRLFGTGGSGLSFTKAVNILQEYAKQENNYRELYNRVKQEAIGKRENDPVVKLAAVLNAENRLLPWSQARQQQPQPGGGPVAGNPPAGAVAAAAANAAAASAAVAGKPRLSADDLTPLFEKFFVIINTHSDQDGVLQRTIRTLAANSPFAQKLANDLHKADLYTDNTNEEPAVFTGVIPCYSKVLNQFDLSDRDNVIRIIRTLVGLQKKNQQEAFTRFLIDNLYRENSQLETIIPKDELNGELRRSLSAPVQVAADPLVLPVRPAPVEPLTISSIQDMPQLSPLQAYEWLLNPLVDQLLTKAEGLGMVLRACFKPESPVLEFLSSNDPVTDEQIRSAARVFADCLQSVFQMQSGREGFEFDDELFFIALLMDHIHPQHRQMFFTALVEKKQAEDQAVYSTEIPKIMGSIQAFKKTLHADNDRLLNEYRENPSLDNLQALIGAVEKEMDDRISVEEKLLKELEKQTQIKLFIRAFPKELLPSTQEQIYDAFVRAEQRESVKVRHWVGKPEPATNLQQAAASAPARPLTVDDRASRLIELCEQKNQNLLNTISGQTGYAVQELYNQSIRQYMITTIILQTSGDRGLIRELLDAIFRRMGNTIVGLTREQMENAVEAMDRALARNYGSNYTRDDYTNPKSRTSSHLPAINPNPQIFANLLMAITQLKARQEVRQDDPAIQQFQHLLAKTLNEAYPDPTWQTPEGQQIFRQQFEEVYAESINSLTRVLATQAAASAAAASGVAAAQPVAAFVRPRSADEIAETVLSQYRQIDAYYSGQSQNAGSNTPFSLKVYGYAKKEFLIDFIASSTSQNPELQAHVLQRVIQILAPGGSLDMSSDELKTVVAIRNRSFQQVYGSNYSEMYNGVGQPGAHPVAYTYLLALNPSIFPRLLFDIVRQQKPELNAVCYADAMQTLDNAYPFLQGQDKRWLWTNFAAFYQDSIRKLMQFQSQEVAPEPPAAASIAVSAQAVAPAGPLPALPSGFMPEPPSSSAAIASGSAAPPVPALPAHFGLPPLFRQAEASDIGSCGLDEQLLDMYYNPLSRFPSSAGRVQASEKTFDETNALLRGLCRKDMGTKEVRAAGQDQRDRELSEAVLALDARSLPVGSKVKDIFERTYVFERPEEIDLRVDENDKDRRKSRLFNRSTVLVQPCTIIRNEQWMPLPPEEEAEVQLVSVAAPDIANAPAGSLANPKDKEKYYQDLDRYLVGDRSPKRFNEKKYLDDISQLMDSVLAAEIALGIEHTVAFPLGLGAFFNGLQQAMVAKGGDGTYNSPSAMQALREKITQRYIESMVKHLEQYPNCEVHLVIGPRDDNGRAFQSAIKNSKLCQRGNERLRSRFKIYPNNNSIEVARRLAARGKVGLLNGSFNDAYTNRAYETKGGVAIEEGIVAAVSPETLTSGILINGGAPRQTYPKEMNYPKNKSATYFMQRVQQLGGHAMVRRADGSYGEQVV